LGRLIYLLTGDRVYQIDRAILERSGAIVRPELVTRKTDFEYFYNDDYAAMVTALTQDQARNRQIIMDAEASRNGAGTALIVSDRKDHLHNLAGMIGTGRAEVLTGDLPAKERQRIVEALNQGKIDFLLSTTSLISEGFDAAWLDRLFLACPIKFKGRLIQTVGRILRPSPGKQALIFDYQDMKQPVLRSQARARSKDFRKMTITPKGQEA
jgi:superfamily II DNA or RNA helicase